MLFPEVENKRLFNDPLEGDLYLLVACVYRLDKDSVYAKAGTSDDVSVDLVAHGDRVVYVAAYLVHGTDVALFRWFAGFEYVIHLHLFVESGNPWLLVVGYQTYLEAHGLELFHELDRSGCGRLIMSHKSVVYVEQYTSVSHVVILFEIYFVCG